MSRWSHREFLLRKEWVDSQWDRPDRTDYYLMQIAAQVYHVLRKGAIDLNKFKIRFKSGAVKHSITHENASQRAARSKTFWAPLIAMAGVKTDSGR